MPLIPYGRQSINNNDIDDVIEVLKSSFLTQGPKIGEFEATIANYVGSQYAIAVNSGTSALHLACLALGLGSGDRLWTSAISFVASANCGRYCGADVDFIDIDPRTLNIDTEKLADKLLNAKREKRLPKILVVVHFAGLPCDMDEIKHLADKFGFYIIEDAAHALGASYQESRIGDCKYSDLCTFSFHPIKSITSGEGGMITTQSERWAEKMRQLRSHGINKDTQTISESGEGDWYYEQTDLGYNYRITDIQAALGISQASRLEHFITQRTAIALRYDKLLVDLPLQLPPRVENRKSAWHLYVIQVEDAKIRRKVFDKLRNEGIGVQVHYIPIHLQPYYRAIGFKRDDFPVAENYYEKTISLPIFPELSEEDQDSVVRILGDALR